MSRTICVPFRSLKPYDFVAAGAAAHVYSINESIVLKVPTHYNNPDATDIADRDAALISCRREKAIYNILTKRKCVHPNILRSILAVPEGIFLERLATTLEFRNMNREKQPVSESTMMRWTRQLVSAVAYLEELGYIHGDLRPANILLSKDDHLKLCDFDSTVTPGCRLQTATPGFSQVSDLKTFQPGVANYGSEQLAIGSCIFAIETGTEPLQDTAEQVQRFFWCQFPPTDGLIFDELIQGCWRKRYSSIAQLEYTIAGSMAMTFENVPAMDDAEFELRVEECRRFLDKNAALEDGLDSMGED